MIELDYTSSVKTVLISGGSRGLGLYFTKHLLSNGINVATFARKSTEATDSLLDLYPESFKFISCDIRDLDVLKNYVQEIVETYGSLDALVNNAAIGQDHLLVHTPPNMIHKIVEINITSLILLTRIVLRQMLLQTKGGRIISISSICGSRGFQAITVYSATKGAVDALTRSLARELEGSPIRVNAIAPGFFESDMSSVLTNEQLESIKRRTPTGRLTTEEHLARVLDFLLFSENNITGQVIFVDGGITI